MSRFENASLQLFVDRLTVRSVLTDEERRAIMALPTHLIVVKARQDFVHINQETSYSCFIASGLVGRFGQTLVGVRQITAFHLAGDMADLHSAVRPIGVGGLTALCETMILRVPHDAIRALAARYPAIAEALWRDCMLDAAILMEWVVNIGRRDAQTRLAHILCEISIRSGRNREVLLDYHFPITQDQLGDASGMTSVHVNRSLKALRDKGLATVKSGQVQIHNWAALAEMGEFNAAYLVADTAPERQKRLLSIP
ncbi:Crp/Fnr family transcriptional regulator [uncultured Sphingomonas sp.]|uniref:Crp/Fnr family transcriptional regulator n=1 Tax=uncultured Sphingomonas sp. TaxID=158754 RepID=UPI0035CA45CC